MRAGPEVGELGAGRGDPVVDDRVRLEDDPAAGLALGDPDAELGLLGARAGSARSGRRPRRTRRSRRTRTAAPTCCSPTGCGRRRARSAGRGRCSRRASRARAPGGRAAGRATPGGRHRRPPAPRGRRTPPPAVRASPARAGRRRRGTRPCRPGRRRPRCCARPRRRRVRCSRAPGSRGTWRGPCARQLGVVVDDQDRLERREGLPGEGGLTGDDVVPAVHRVRAHDDADGAGDGSGSEGVRLLLRLGLCPDPGFTADPTACQKACQRRGLAWCEIGHTHTARSPCRVDSARARASRARSGTRSRWNPATPRATGSSQAPAVAPSLGNRRNPWRGHRPAGYSGTPSAHSLSAA